MGIPHCDAEELVQTTFIRVNENIGDFHYDRSRGRFSSWLLVILGNLARDYWRRAQREGKRRVVQRPSNSSTQTQPLYRIASPQKDQVFNQVLAHELQRVFQEGDAEFRNAGLPTALGNLPGLCRRGPRKQRSRGRIRYQGRHRVGH